MAILLIELTLLIVAARAMLVLVVIEMRLVAGILRVAVLRITILGITILGITILVAFILGAAVALVRLVNRDTEPFVAIASSLLGAVIVIVVVIVGVVIAITGNSLGGCCTNR
jgi:hypothetical protein